MSDLERRQPATKFFQSFALLNVDVCLSVTAIRQAYGAVKRQCDAVPEVLLVSPNIVHYAKHLFTLYGEYMPADLTIWSRPDFPKDQWCLGSFQEPMFFVGSKDL